MNYTILGRTGLKVSVMGLGAGGHSRLGLSQQQSEQESVAIVQRALELGVNFIDTAEAYGTETVIGQATAKVPRDSLVLSSKYSLHENGILREPHALEASLDRSLQRLKTDYVDIYHLHGVKLEDYPYAQSHLVPELIKMRDKGKIRFLGITEGFASDPAHVMLQTAVKDNDWDVIMVGFNILNQSARNTVLPLTIQKNIGVLDMFAVRKALTRTEVLASYIQDMIDRGVIAEGLVDVKDPLGFLLQSGAAESLPDASYRFVRHEPGVHCVLVGTGNLDHLEANARSVNRAPLDAAVVKRLREIFEGVDSVSGN